MAKQPKQDEKRAVELACKRLSVKPSDLRDWAIREEAGQVVVILPSGQKYVYDIEWLEAEAAAPTRAKVDSPPPQTTQLKTPAPETAEAPRGRLGSTPTEAKGGKADKG